MYKSVLLIMCYSEPRKFDNRICTVMTLKLSMIIDLDNMLFEMRKYVTVTILSPSFEILIEYILDSKLRY